MYKKEVRAKFQYWSAIIDHILKPIGGRQPIAENNCDCAVCQRDLSMMHDESGIIRPVWRAGFAAAGSALRR